MYTQTVRALLTPLLVLQFVVSYASLGAESSGREDSIAQLRERGAVVEVDDQGDAVSVRLFGEFTNDDLRLLCGLSKLTELDIAGGEVSDAGLAIVGEIGSLQDLEITNRSITTKGIGYLTKLKQLRKLNLMYTSVDDDVASFLPRFPNLEELWLGQTKITDTGLEQIGRIASLRSLSLTADKITDAGIVHLARLSKLRKLVLHDTQIADSGLESLGRMSGLEELYLGSVQMGGPGFAAISKLPNLRTLYLTEASVDDDAVAPLACAPRLEKLYLDGTRIGDAGLEEMGLARMKNLCLLHLPWGNVTDRGVALIAGLTELRELHLPPNNKVTDAGMKCIGNLTKLEALVAREATSDVAMAEIGKLVNLNYLDLVGARVTDAGLVHLKDLPKLEYLNLSCCRVTDAGLETLSKLTQLKKLKLGITPITDKGLRHLESLTSLQRLIVTGSMVTLEAVDRLKKKLPNTDIYGGRVREGFIEFDQNDLRVEAEREKLAGTWKGRAIPDEGEKPADAAISFAKERVTFSGESGESISATYKLDPTKSPKWLDFAMDVDGWVVESKAIYELESGVLRLSAVEDGDQRPKDFSDKESKYARRAELRRVDKDEKAK